MTFNNTIVCFYSELLAHSFHKLNMKGAEISSQSKCKVSIPELLSSWFSNLNNIIAMHFYMIAIYFYINLFHISSGKKNK